MTGISWNMTKFLAHTKKYYLDGIFKIAPLLRTIYIESCYGNFMAIATTTVSELYVVQSLTCTTNKHTENDFKAKCLNVYIIQNYFEKKSDLVLKAQKIHIAKTKQNRIKKIKFV